MGAYGGSSNWLAGLVGGLSGAQRGLQQWQENDAEQQKQAAAEAAQKATAQRQAQLQALSELENGVSDRAPVPQGQTSLMVPTGIGPGASMAMPVPTGTIDDAVALSGPLAGKYYRPSQTKQAQEAREAAKIKSQTAAAERTQRHDAAIAAGFPETQAQLYADHPEIAGDLYMTSPGVRAGKVADAAAENATRLAGEMRLHQTPTYGDLHPHDAKDHFVSAGVDANGQPVILNTSTGETVAGGGFHQGAGGGSTGAQVPVADMQARFGEIEQHAKDLAAGKWKMSRSMQTREGLDYGISQGNNIGKPPMIETAAAGVLGTLGIGSGGHNGQDYQRYQALMNSQRALGDDVAKVFKGRQNEQAVIRETTLAQLTPTDYGNPQVVAQKLNRLRNVIHLAELNNPSQLQGQQPQAHAPAQHDRAAQLRAKYGIQ